MSTYVEEPNAIRGRFNWVSYGKSGTVLSMFLNSLTPNTFHKGLHYYLNDKYYDAAEPEDLFRGLQRAYNEDFPAGTLNIESIMGSWVYQAGYPLVTIEKSGSNFVLTQARYPTGNGEIYAIPLTLSTKASPQFDRKTPSLWLRDASMTIPQSQLNVWGNDWIILNNQQCGFYRVNYGQELWMAIRDDLRENSSAIHLTNRRVLQEELNIGGVSIGKLKFN
jgi:aminopeptidase N